MSQRHNKEAYTRKYAKWRQSYEMGTWYGDLDFSSLFLVLADRRRRRPWGPMGSTTCDMAKLAYRERHIKASFVSLSLSLSLSLCVCVCVCLLSTPVTHSLTHSTPQKRRWDSDPYSDSLCLCMFPYKCQRRSFLHQRGTRKWRNSGLLSIHLHREIDR